MGRGMPDLMNEVSQLKTSLPRKMTTEAYPDHEPLLTSVEVVYRRIARLKAQPQVARRIEEFLDYAPHYEPRRACSLLSLRLVERVFASQTWDQDQVVQALASAALEGRLDVMEWLRKKEKEVAGVETKDLITGFEQRQDCYNPLCTAAINGHIDVFQWLVDKGADVNEKDFTGRTALITAASGGRFAAVKWLIKKGARVNEPDRDGFTALHGAVVSGKMELVKYLVEEGAHIQQATNAGMTALHYVVGALEADMDLVHYILDNGLHASDADECGRTALHFASVYGGSEMVEFLLKEGFKEAQPPLNDLRRAFVDAVKTNNLALMNYLMDYGVDIHFVSFRGWNALHEAAPGGGGVDVVKTLLENGLDAQLPDKFGITPLMEACRYGRQDILDCLLNPGGSINNVDRAGRSALHLAAQGGHTDIVALLLKNGADIHCSDHRGCTPLHNAAAAGKNCEVIELLIANGANLDAKTLSGQTAEDLARTHPDVARCLKNLRVGSTESEEPGRLAQVVLSKYKKYLLDPTQVHFSSITAALHGYADGSWQGNPIAVRVKKPNWSSHTFVEALEKWSQLNHPHIVKLYGFCHFDDAYKEPFFVCERYSYASLLDYLGPNSALTLEDIWEKMYQVALGLKYLHDHDIVHDTLSAASVMIASNGEAKLHVFDQDVAGYLPWSAAPEVLAGLPASFKSDIFAFGFIIIQAMKRGAAIWGACDDDSPILSGKLPEKPDAMTANQWSVVERMCCFDFHDRLSVSDVVRELEAITRHTTATYEYTSETENAPCK